MNFLLDYAWVTMHYFRLLFAMASGANSVWPESWISVTIHITGRTFVRSSTLESHYDRGKYAERSRPVLSESCAFAAVPAVTTPFT